MRTSLAIVALILLAAPLGALAQTSSTPTPPPPQPTPPPGWHAPDGDPGAPIPRPPDPGLRATEVLPDEMLRRPRSQRPFGRPMVAPTLGIAIAARSVKNHEELSTSSVDFWLGARFHPFLAKAAPFVAFGTEVNIRELPRLEPLLPEQESVTYTEFTPEMRWGFVFLRAPHRDYLNVVFPNVEVYGITGWRLANRHQGHALRIGVGVSAPIVTALSVMAEVPLPAMLEVTMDADSLHSGEREFAVRFGWHF